MNKLTKTAKTIDTVANILFWLCAVGGGIFVAAAIFIAVLHPALLEGSTSTLSLGPVTFDLAPEYAMSEWASRLVFGFGALFIAVAVVCACIGLRLVRGILAPMKEARPFDVAVHSNLKKLAWLILGGGAVISLLGAVTQGVILYTAHLDEIFDSSAISGMTAELSVDLSFVPVFAVVYLLALVFQYGEELQTQSDETL